MKNLNFVKILTKLRIFFQSYLEFIVFESHFKHYKLTYFLIGLLSVVFFSSYNLEEFYGISHIPELSYFKNIVALVCFGIFLTTYLDYKTRNKKTNYQLIILWYVLILLILPCFSCIFLLATNLEYCAIAHSLITTLLLSSLLQPALFIIFNLLGYFIGYLYYLFFLSPITIWSDLNHALMSNLLIMFIGFWISYLRQISIKALMMQTTELEAININLEDLINQRTIEIQEALKLKSDFVNNASHEIRIPLQGILGVTEILHTQWQKLSEVKRYEYINLINHSCNRLMLFASNLLDFAKFNVGKTTLSLTLHDIVALTKEIITDFQSFATSKGIKIFVVPSKEEIVCLLDKAKVAQVVRNLISNSLKYSESDTQIIIEMNHLADISLLQLKFIDQGMGIAESEHEKIFEAFAQSSKAFSHLNSTGLGLALVAEYIKMHKGTISVANNNPTGSIFTVTIPYSQNKTEFDQLYNKKNIGFMNPQEASAAIIYINDEIKPLPEDNLQKRPKIDISKSVGLIVDDEVICLISTSLMLESLSVEIHTEKDGHKVLERLNERKYDFLLLDIMLNGITGVEILDSIRADKRYSKLPVILQSGVVDSSIIQTAMNLGASAHLIKPYSKIELVEVLQKVISSANI
ncbi:MAG: hybrid sensor histidine kinase/response regulator [Rickettsiaceae bacterium]|nr:hybrid sensor histidine kinase/response regulator [Rickettsiaceae bacterium]